MKYIQDNKLQLFIKGEKEDTLIDSGMYYYDLSPAKLWEDLCVKRYQIFLDTGVYPDGLYNKTWDMLAWLSWNKNK